MGRLVNAIEDIGQLDNTLVFYIVGDNGASAEGGMNGLFNEMTYFNGVNETVQDIMKRYDELGSPATYSHYGAGWAVAGNTPFTWAKQVASSYGGTRNGMVIHWPRGFKAKGELRSQWHHIIDIAPTILEAAGLPEPKAVNGITQIPIEGVSMRYTFSDAGASDRHRPSTSRSLAIGHIQQWMACRYGSQGTVGGPSQGNLDNDRWELYDTKADFSLANDLALKNPNKLKEMQALFIKEAIRYSVLPIDDRGIERTNPALAGRPDLMAGRTSLTVYEGMIGMSENVFINIKNRSHTVTAEVQIPKDGANGVLLSQAGRFGGWSLYMKSGKPMYTYNWLGLKHYTIAAGQPLPAGKAVIRFEFAYDGGGVGKGGTGKLFVNGKSVAQGRIENTHSNVFSADEGTDVGQDGETPVVEDYGIPAPFEFTGSIDRITIDLKDSSALDVEKADRAQKEARIKKALSD